MISNKDGFILTTTQNIPNNNNVINVNQPRRGLRELNNLGPVQCNSRLRSGRN